MGDIFDEVAEEYKKQYKGDIFDEVAEQYTPKEPPFEVRHPNLYALGKTAIEVPKLIGKRLGAGALEGLAKINKLLTPAPLEKYTVTPALKWAEELRKSARGEGKLDEGLLSFIEGIGTMIPTLPADIMTGGATKAALVPRITEKAAKILAKIPDFAIGMGIRGFAGGIEEGKPLKAIQQAIENTGFGLIYSKLEAGRLKDLPKWLAVGIAEPTYQATKQGRLPTPEELINGLGANTGYFLLFSALPILKQNIKDAAERKAIEKYEKKLQKTEDPEKEIEELFKDPAISEQTKKSLKQLVDEGNKALASTPAQTQLPLKPSAPAPESSVELLRQLYEEAGLLRQAKKKLSSEMQKPEEKPEVKPEPITPEPPEKPATQDIFDEVEKEIKAEQKPEVEKAKKETKPELETLTEEEKQILRNRGFTESQIDRLLPEEGRKLIDEGLSPEEVSVLRNGKIKVIKKKSAVKQLKNYPDLTKKHKKTKIRFDLLPDGWKMVVGRTRTKEGHSAEAEVDWFNKQIVFSKKEFMDNPDIANHEIAHVIIESSLPENKRKQLYDAYVKAKKTEWKKQGADPNWIVKNRFHHEAIAIDLGQYLTDPAKVNPDVAKVFRQFLTPENIFGKGKKEIKPEQKSKREVAVKQSWEMTRDEFESDNMLGEKPHVLYHLSKAEIEGEITKGFAADSPMRALINIPYAEKGTMYVIKYDPDKVKKSDAHIYSIRKPVEIIAIIPKEYWRNPHKYFVEQALKEGKPVPPEVLKDYPDLAEKYKTQLETKKEKAWLTDEPFTKDEVDFFNQFSNFSIDINKEFKNIIQKKENAVKNKLKEYGLQEIPPDLKQALEQYRKALYNFFLAKAKASSIAPPISVVGRAKYKGNIKRAEAIEKKANEQLKKAEAKIDNILSKLTSGIAPTQKRTQIHYSELKGSKIKKALNADFATKRYHNKHKDGSGSIGFTIGKGDKTYNLTASYDKNGYLYDISFGVYPDAGKPINSKTYNDLIENLKKVIETKKAKNTAIKGVKEGEVEYEAVTRPEEVRESLKFKPEQLTLQFTEPEQKRGQVSYPTKQRVVLRTTGYIKAQGYVVRNADDTASLLSPLRKKAQEEVYFVIADKDGRVLEILRYSKGTKKASEIEPSEIAGRIFSIPNAKKVYFVHNHPAVSHQPSASDVRVYTKLKDIFALGGIDTEGLVISGKYYTAFNEAEISEPQEIKPAVRKVKIPVKERFIVREPSFWKATFIQTPEKAIEAIKEYQNKDGFLILNTKNRNIGFYVYDPNKSAQENFVNLAKLVEATNANAVIFNTKKLTPEQASLYELITSRGFIPVYDVIENGKSLRAKGELDAKITQARLANPVEENIIHYTAGSVADTAKEILKFAKDSKIDIDPEDLSLLRLYSDIPSWLRNESPEFRKVFDVVDERWRNFNTIRNTYLKELFDAWKPLNKREKERVGKILYKGDELRKELSDEALAKLTPNERKAYKVTREVLNFIWNEELPMLMEELGVPKTEIEQYRRKVGNVTGYMPHPRKGAYYIFVKDPKTKEILYHTMFDDLIATLTGGKYSPKGAKLKKILREQFGADKIIKIGKHTEQFPEEAYFEVSPLVTQELINVAMKKVEGSEELKQAFKQAIEQAVADVFKVRGFMKHGIKRKGIPGYDVENWQDAVIEYINGWAGYKSKLLAAKKLNEVWGKINWGQKHNLRAYAEKYVKDTFANQTQFDRAVDKFRAFLFYKYLGGVLKSAVLQLTQNFVTAIPRLTVETNWAGSKLTAEMMRSGIDLIKALYTKPAEGMSRRETVMAKRLTEEELRALSRARLDGTISDQLTEEVMGMMPGKYGSLPREFAKALRWMFGVAEIFNRETTFLTAFRIARREKRMNFEDAYKFASKIIDETHFRYGKFNLPPFARGGKLAKVARSAYTFRSFTHNILHLYKSLASDYGWRGKWGLTKSFMAILALAGIKGLPFASTINWAYRKVTGSDLFQDIAEIVGDWYKAVLYGAPSFLGVDLTGSISIEIPRTLKELIGVPYDIGSGLAKTYQDIQTRDFWRAVEDFPLFLNIMRYPLQAYRLTTRGIETKHGKRVVDSDFKPLKLTTGEGLLKAFGFQPITLSEAYRKAETGRAIREVWKEKKDTLVSAWAKAVNRGDEETAKGLLEQMMEYNKEVAKKVPPDVAKGLFITNETLWRRMQPERLRALERR